MTGSTRQIIEDFYDAAWDLGADLIYLRDKALTGGETSASPDSITANFREKATPFLKLTGDDLPPEMHLPFMQIEETLNESVFPGLMVLEEEWQNHFHSTQPKHADEAPSLAIINNGCASLCNTIEMEIIVLAAGMRP